MVFLVWMSGLMLRQVMSREILAPVVFAGEVVFVVFDQEELAAL